MESQVSDIIKDVRYLMTTWLSDEQRVNEEGEKHHDRGADFDTLAAHLLLVEKNLTARAQCLPLRFTLDVLEATQSLWASTVHGQARVKDDAAVAIPRYRFLITHLFLIANNVFAPPGVRDDYLRHHIPECEKAAIMCLQTGKRFLNAADVSENVPRAQELLELACTLTTACAGERAFNPNLAVEVAFARLQLSWSSAEATHAVLELAEKLVGHITGNRVYMELFIQFVFALDQKPVENEDTLRGLLQLSLRLLGTGPEEDSTASTKLSTFKGTSHLQLALSHLRSGAYVSASDAAAAASSLLNSVEPLVVQLKALAYQGAAEAALPLFRDVSERLSTADGSPSEEAFGLADLLIETNPTLSEAVISTLRDKTMTACSRCGNHATASLPHLIAFLLHANTAFSAEAVVQVLAEVDTPVDMHRYLFSCLCSLLQPTCVPHSLPDEVVASGLSLALSRFADTAASVDEAEAVVTQLAIVLLPAQDISDDAAAAAAITGKDYEALLTLFERHNQRAGSLGHVVGAPCTVMHALTLFHLERDGDALVLIHSLLNVSDVVTRAGAFGTLVNSLLAAGKVKATATVAEVLLSSCDVTAGSFPTPTGFLEMARVYVVGLLRDMSDEAAELHQAGDPVLATLSTALLDVLVEKVSPVLHDVVFARTLDAGAVEWWCKCFWIAAHLVCEPNHSAAVALTHSALEWFDATCVGVGDTHTRALLAHQSGFLLEMEFALFVTGCPWLTVPQLQVHVARLVDCLSVEEAPPLSLLMARAELDMRRVLESPPDDASDHAAVKARLVAHGDAMHAHGAESHDLEALAAALQRSSNHVGGELGQAFAAAAVAVQLLALLPETAQDAGVSRRRHNALVCYKAYQMSRSSAERLRIVKVIADGQQMPALPDTTPDGELAPELECIVEYFTVEAWNATVRSNASHDRPATLEWREVALLLGNSLTTASVTRSTVSEFASKMPLL